MEGKNKIDITIEPAREMNWKNIFQFLKKAESAGAAKKYLGKTKGTECGHFFPKGILTIITPEPRPQESNSIASNVLLPYFDKPILVFLIFKKQKCK